ncbi:hypothetical protein MCERE19_04387 [Spirosomataceae bacterium]
MKQKIALLFTALFLFGFTQAQVSKESYEKAVDFLNCKTVELSLKDDKNLSEFQNKCPCGTTNYTQINQFLTSVKLAATVSLSNEVEGLKKSFKGNSKKDEVLTFLSESVFKDKTKYQKISAFADKRKGKPEFDNYKVSLKADIGNTLTESVPLETVIPTNTNIQQSALDDSITNVEEKINTKEEQSGFWRSFSNYLIILSFLIGITSLYLGLKKQNIENIYDALINKLIGSQRMNSHFQSQNSFSNTSNNHISRSELQSVYKRITDLESEISSLKDKINDSDVFSSQTVQILQPYIQDLKQSEVITQTFFLSTPNSDGSFNESSSSSTYKEGATIYRFTKIGSNRAKFQIDEKDASARLALQYPDKNIDPVCDAVNAFNPKSTRITTVEQGEAELQNGKWVVDRNKKVKIKYEN